eukprot:SAG25_NODE_12716_length_276_cov_0.587571_1_plen_52_part_01
MGGRPATGTQHISEPVRCWELARGGGGGGEAAYTTTQCWRETALSFSSITSG